MQKFVYEFTEGGKDEKDLLGGKGANLAEMTRLGLPVPPGFTVTTEACRRYLTDGAVPPELRVQVTRALRALEDRIGRQLGDPQDPLLVSVRSGAKFSMPGMMETVLNVGCGYVYSDAHTTPDQAKAEIEQALGHPIEPRNDIRIDAGRLDAHGSAIAWPWVCPRPSSNRSRRPRSTAPWSS